MPLYLLTNIPLSSVQHILFYIIELEDWRNWRGYENDKNLPTDCYMQTATKQTKVSASELFNQKGRSDKKVQRLIFYPGSPSTSRNSFAVYTGS